MKNRGIYIVVGCVAILVVLVTAIAMQTRIIFAKNSKITELEGRVAQLRQSGEVVGKNYDKIDALFVWAIEVVDKFDTILINDCALYNVEAARRSYDDAVDNLEGIADEYLKIKNDMQDFRLITNDRAIRL